MFYVSPSYRGLPVVRGPYTKGDKDYVVVLKGGKEKEIRAYADWQSSWSEKDRPRVERDVIVNGRKCYRAVNYNGRYGAVVGIRECNGRLGFWKYKKDPKFLPPSSANVVKTILWGWIGTADKPPIEELDPYWVDEEEVKVDIDCYAYLEG